MIPDQSQERFARTQADHVRLLAPAGSGKTLSILMRCKAILETQENQSRRFLVLTFTRVARDELLHRVISDSRFSDLRNKLRIDTLNQWGYNYLRKNIQPSLKLKTSSADLHALVAHTLRPVWANLPPANDVLERHANLYRPLMKVFSDLKTLGFNHQKGPDVVERFLDHIFWVDSIGLNRFYEVSIVSPLTNMGFLPAKGKHTYETYRPFVQFWAAACQHLWESALITLEDQKYWALLKLREKYPDNATFPDPNRYHYLIVDEFQDINPLDLYLIKELRRVNRSMLTLVGDDDQAIYEWRGASPEFILDPKGFFGLPFETHTLEVNYRCPKNITALSQQLIRHNERRVPKNVASYSQRDAEIVLKAFDDHTDALPYIVEQARTAWTTGIPKALAVISRKKCQLIPLQISLTSEDIPYYAREDLNVLLSEAFEDLREILVTIPTKAERKYSKDIVKSFIACCNKVYMYPMRKADENRLFSRLLSRQPHTFMECLSIFQQSEPDPSTLRVAITIARMLESDLHSALLLKGLKIKGLQFA